MENHHFQWKNSAPVQSPALSAEAPREICFPFLLLPQWRWIFAPFPSLSWEPPTSQAQLEVENKLIFRVRFRRNMQSIAVFTDSTVAQVLWLCYDIFP